VAEYSALSLPWDRLLTDHITTTAGGTDGFALTECATCHVYLPDSAPQSDITDDEEDMLGYAMDYNENESRLACQIKVTREFADWSLQEGCKGVGLPRF
jgi:hypothetical protein